MCCMTQRALSARLHLAETKPYLAAAYMVFGLDVQRQLVSQDLTAIGSTKLREMIGTGWAEMTEVGSGA